MGRLLPWFATEAGRKFSRICTTAASTVITFGYFLPNTYFLEKYEDFVRMYRSGSAVPLPEKLLLQMQQVLDDLDVPERERKLLKPFTVFGFDPFHAGTTYSKFGAIIGFPINFTYKDVTGIDKSQILIRNEAVDWSTDDGQNLLNALVLSEEAQKFAIGREILRSRTMELPLNTLYPVSMITLVYAFSCTANQKLDGFARPLAFRVILYSLVGLFGLGSWMFMKDFTTVYYDTDSDKILCALGPEYIRGGQEFYEKILQRNIALRGLLGSAGDKLYTAMGNEQFFIRQKRLPITYRKAFFDGQLKNLESS